MQYNDIWKSINSLTDPHPLLNEAVEFYCREYRKFILTNYSVALHEYAISLFRLLKKIAGQFDTIIVKDDKSSRFQFANAFLPNSLGTIEGFIYVCKRLDLNLLNRTVLIKTPRNIFRKTKNKFGSLEYSQLNKYSELTIDLIISYITLTSIPGFYSYTTNMSLPRSVRVNSLCYPVYIYNTNDRTYIFISQMGIAHSFGYYANFLDLLIKIGYETTPSKVSKIEILPYVSGGCLKLLDSIQGFCLQAKDIEKLIYFLPYFIYSEVPDSEERIENFKGIIDKYRIDICPELKKVYNSLVVENLVRVVPS